MISKEEFLTVKNLIIIIIVCAVLVFFVSEYLFNVKIGRTACKIVGYSIFAGGNRIGLVSDAGLALFFTTCDKINW